MAKITYTARRSLAAGHEQGLEYTLEIDLQSFNPSSDPVTKKQRSLGGNTQTILHRIDKGASVTTDWVSNADKPLWIEFLDSVAAGESFTFDPYGTVANPVREAQYELDGSPSFSRIGTTDLFAINFTVREL